MSISGFFSSMVEDVEHFFDDDVLPVAQAFIKSLVSSLVSNGGNLLITTAQAAVSEAVQTGGDAGTVLNNAVSSAKNTLATSGVSVVEEAVVGAVAAALAQVKSEQASAASASANALGS